MGEQAFYSTSRGTKDMIPDCVLKIGPMLGGSFMDPHEKILEGMKYDGEKERFDLLPFDVLEEVAKVLTVGAKKYADRNWESGMDWGRPFAAALRHMSAFWQRESFDKDTNCHHLACAIAELMFLLAYDFRGTGNDNRGA